MFIVFNKKNKALFILFCLSLSTFLLNASAVEKNYITLKVKPSLYVLGKKQKPKQHRLLVTWKSQVSKTLCLYSDQKKPPLKCWKNASKGQFTDNPVITKNIHYILKEKNNPELLAKTKFVVMSSLFKDRRKQRRRRHVWSIL